MAVYVFGPNAAVYYDQLDLSSYTREVTLDYAVEEQDATTLQQNTRIAKGGLTTVGFSIGGFHDHADPDSTVFDGVGTRAAPFTFCPNGYTEAGRAFLTQPLQTAYNPLGASVGDMSAFSFTGTGRGVPLVRGQLLHADSAARTSSGAAPQPAPQLGAVAAGERMYASLHVLAASGSTPTLDVVVQSDDNEDMTSATARITFTQAGAVTSEWSSVAGAVTDDYWRVSYTIGGGSPSFTFVVAAGIA